MVTVSDVIKIRKINELLNKLEFCKKHTSKPEIKLFLMSIEKQYISKNELTEKQLKALDNIYNAIKEYEEIIWDEVSGSHLDIYGND